MNPSFWQRFAAPLRAQLLRGTSPNRLAFTLGVGAACSLFPFLGFTTLLNLTVGAVFKLNHAVLQALNQLLGPVQLVLILVYVRVGEWLWRASAADRFTLGEMVDTFRQNSLAEFLQRFGLAGLHAFSAWLLTAPLLVLILSLGTKPLLRRLLPTPP